MLGRISYRNNYLRISIRKERNLEMDDEEMRMERLETQREAEFERLKGYEWSSWENE